MLQLTKWSKLRFGKCRAPSNCLAVPDFQHCGVKMWVADRLLNYEMLKFFLHSEK